jgi:putative ABC transport system ATP-binding protein
MILSLEHIHKAYEQGDRKVQVLKDLNFAVNEAKSIAILGKSGSGKSTFLSLVAGLDKPQQGAIKIDNTDIVPMGEDELALFRAKKLGIIFQQFHLMSTLTALENVMLPLEILQQENVQEQAREVLNKVGLDHRLDHFPSELSGGECQRVAIARALVTRPKLLLADEPSGNLDSDTGEVVMELLFNLVKDYQTTMLLVTHDKELAQKCDSMFTLKDQGLHAN